MVATEKGANEGCDWRFSLLFLILVIAISFLPEIPFLFKIFLIPLGCVSTLLLYFLTSKRSFRRFKNQTIINILMVPVVILAVILIVLMLIQGISFIIEM